jgi:hypothetical protein
MHGGAHEVFISKAVKSKYDLNGDDATSNLSKKYFEQKLFLLSGQPPYLSSLYIADYFKIYKKKLFFCLYKLKNDKRMKLIHIKNVR